MERQEGSGLRGKVGSVPHQWRRCSCFMKGRRARREHFPVQLWHLTKTDGGDGRQLSRIELSWLSKFGQWFKWKFFSPVA